MPNQAGCGSVSTTGDHISAPQVKKRMCSSACTAAVVQRRLVEERDVPDVEVDGPDRQRDERVARGSRSLSNGRIASTGRSTGPVRPATKQSGARSPSRMCCDHVDEEEVRLAELVDRRVDRQHEQEDPEPEEELPPAAAPAGRGAPASACAGSRRTTTSDRRQQLERREVPAGQVGGERARHAVSRRARRARAGQCAAVQLFHYHLVTSQVRDRRGALPGQARLPARRALRPRRRAVGHGRAGRAVGDARARRLQAAPDRGAARRRSTSSSSRACGACRASTTSAW